MYSNGLCGPRLTPPLADCGLKKVGSDLAQWLNENAKMRRDRSLPFLSELDVSNNSLDADFARWAGQLMATPACPAVLRLAANKLNGKATRALVDGLASSKSAARDLKLGGADLSDVGTMELLCGALERDGAPQLERLSLRDCQLAPRGVAGASTRQS